MESLLGRPPAAMNAFGGRLALQQRVLPSYRTPFFDALARVCTDGLSVFAGQPRPDEAIQTTDKLEAAQYIPARNRHFLREPFYLCWQSGLPEWLKSWDPDALIVEANPRYMSTPSAIRWMHTLHRPVIGWGLGAPPITGPLSALRQRRRLTFLNSLDAVIAYSQRGASEYRTLGLPPERVFVATNAAAPRPTSPPSERPPAFEGQPTLLFVGRLQARKRVDLLLEACANLPEEMQPHLLIVGDGPARAEFEAQVRAHYPAAEFLGAKHGEELEPFFATADLFVLPGTGGLAVQEAMAHGLPVIVAEGDGTQEDLVRPENGWLVPPDDLSALTAALRQALADPARLRRMGRESYRIAAEEVNIEAMVEVFLQVLQQVR